MGVVFNVDKESHSRPIKRFGNGKTRPLTGITIRETIYGILFDAVYFGTHLVSWNQFYPTQAELYLCRISNLVLLGLLAAYLIVIPIGVVSSRPFPRRWQTNEVSTRMGSSHDPRPSLGYISGSAVLHTFEGFDQSSSLAAQAYADMI